MRSRRRGKREVGYSVNAKRLAWKQAHLGPTLFQQQLLEYLKKRKELPFVESVGLNWTMLGGLFARGICTWERRPEGQFLVMKW